MNDTQFLALLVHRGHLARSEAESLIAGLREGGELDELLRERLGWDAAHVARLRRTRAGEEPEIPGYELHGRLGSGGTSDVFRALEKKSGRIVALKVLNAASTRDEATRSAFVKEARLLERLSHPGIVRGYGVAKSGTTYFSILECVEGSTLQELLDQGQRFPEERGFGIVLAAAEVLAYLAENQVLHRDVKPGNIMLDHNANVKLIDLGFADRERAGTKEYVSPEVASGGASDMRSDIYSLGVTLFQLVIGRLPFEGATDEDLLRKHIGEKLSSPELKGLGHSPHLQYLVHKMMAKEAGVRYQSWSELIADVRAQLDTRTALEDASRTSASAPAPKTPPRRRRF